MTEKGKFGQKNGPYTKPDKLWGGQHPDSTNSETEINYIEWSEHKIS